MFCQNKRHTNLNLSWTYKEEPRNYSIAVLSLKNDNILVILNLKFNKKQICKVIKSYFGLLKCQDVGLGAVCKYR